MSAWPTIHTVVNAWTFRGAEWWRRRQWTPWLSPSNPAYHTWCCTPPPTLQTTLDSNRDHKSMYYYKFHSSALVANPMENYLENKRIYLFFKGFQKMKVVFFSIYTFTKVGSDQRKCFPEWYTTLIWQGLHLPNFGFKFFLSIYNIIFFATLKKSMLFHQKPLKYKGFT